MIPTCRHCQTPLTLEFLDLGHAPPSNANLAPEGLRAAETTYPLRLKACPNCRLVQTEDFAGLSGLAPVLNTTCPMAT